VLIAKHAGESYLLPQMASRHGLVAAAACTGKTVAPQVLAEARGVQPRPRALALAS